MSVMVNTKMIWHHPKYYAELRKRGRELTSSQAKADKQPAGSQGFKLQAKILKRKDPRTRVQAIIPKLRVTSYKHIGILWMFHVE